ncbi:MAG TPA: flagellar protein [Clostridia bacterium]|nr:flagellar protein [Clostridia bacterium]
MGVSNRIDLTRPVVPELPFRPEPRKPEPKSSTSFQQVLQESIRATSTIQFSKHAMERIRNRNLELTADKLARVEQGVQEAARKGCRESLVLLDDMAFIVSIENNTVVTALDSRSMKNNVFTNIDSAVIV